MEAAVGRRTADRISAAVLGAVVLLSWGYVIYAASVTAQWQLEKILRGGAQ